jgi:hypothetical protein
MPMMMMMMMMMMRKPMLEMTPSHPSDRPIGRIGVHVLYNGNTSRVYLLANYMPNYIQSTGPLELQGQIKWCMTTLIQ